MEKKEFFEITSISRDDLDAAGFDVSDVDDDTMAELASKMADDYLEQMYWDSMKILAESLGIPKKHERDNEGYYHIGCYKVNECYDSDTNEDFYTVYDKDYNFVGEIHHPEIEIYKILVDGKINEENMLYCIETL